MSQTACTPNSKSTDDVACLRFVDISKESLKRLKLRKHHSASAAWTVQPKVGHLGAVVRGGGAATVPAAQCLPSCVRLGDDGRRLGGISGRFARQVVFSLPLARLVALQPVAELVQMSRLDAFQVFERVYQLSILVIQRNALNLVDGFPFVHRFKRSQHATRLDASHCHRLGIQFNDVQGIVIAAVALFRLEIGIFPGLWDETLVEKGRTVGVVSRWPCSTWEFPSRDNDNNNHPL
jgi:hypothetical protein